MDPVVLTLIMVGGICGMIIACIYIKSEIFGFLVSILGTIGLITLLYQYLLPEIEKTGDPLLLMAFWMGSLMFLIVFVFLVWFMLHQNKKLKKETKRQKREIAHLKKEQKKR